MEKELITDFITLGSVALMGPALLMEAHNWWFCEKGHTNKPVGFEK